MTPAPNILVLADDLTGAAEIAAIAHRHNLPTRLLRTPPPSFLPGVTILDTHTRSLPPSQAPAALLPFLATLHPTPFHLIYKKTDSALRGPILPELQALLSHFHLARALLLPQNPSKSRTIKDAHYHIAGTPLHQTPFAQDPHHPARTSHAPTLLGSPLHYCDPPPGRGTSAPLPEGITLCGATTADHLAYWSSHLTPTTLPAGSADFFTAILTHHFHLTPTRPFNTSSPTPPILHICGTTHAAETASRARALHIPTFSLNDAPANFVTRITVALTTHPHVLLTIDRPIDPTFGAAERLHTALADLVANVLQRANVSTLLAEGGATAAAVCARLQYHAFTVDSERASGVVSLRPKAPAAPLLILKPGSYPWPDSVFQPTTS